MIWNGFEGTGTIGCIEKHTKVNELQQGKRQRIVFADEAYRSSETRAKLVYGRGPPILLHPESIRGGRLRKSHRICYGAVVEG